MKDLRRIPASGVGSMSGKVSGKVLAGVPSLTVTTVRTVSGREGSGEISKKLTETGVEDMIRLFVFFGFFNSTIFCKTCLFSFFMIWGPKKISVFQSFRENRFFLNNFRFLLTTWSCAISLSSYCSTAWTWKSTAFHYYSSMSRSTVSRLALVSCSWCSKRET